MLYLQAEVREKVRHCQALAAELGMAQTECRGYQHDIAGLQEQMLHLKVCRVLSLQQCLVTACLVLVHSSCAPAMQAWRGDPASAACTVPAAAAAGATELIAALLHRASTLRCERGRGRRTRSLAPRTR